VTTQEQRWAVAERRLDDQLARRVRRTPGIVVAIVGLLVLAVALTAAVDLRRLATPRGTALAWTAAATVGDCRAFLRLSRPTGPDPRTDDQVCHDLRAATAPARKEAARIDLRAGAVTTRGSAAYVDVVVRRPGGTRTLTLRLVRRNGRWRVARDPGACAETPCY